MKTFRFSLQKYVLGGRYGLRERVKEKVVFVDAEDILSAMDIIRKNWSDWTISMFWLVRE